VRFEIFLYDPHDGESVYVDHVRLSTAKMPTPKSPQTFRVVRSDGTSFDAAGIQDLAAKLKDQWKPPTPKTVEQAEAEFRSKYDAMKKDHPKAVLAVFRDGEK